MVLRAIQDDESRQWGGPPARGRPPGRPIFQGSGPPLIIDWTKYSTRALALAERYPSAAEILTYYAKCVSGQHSPDPSSDLAASIARHIHDLSHAIHQPKVTPPWPTFCPCCGSPPGAAVLRPEADGSRRALVCSHCAYEWPYQRILCSNCDEQRFESLPVYVAQEFPHLRVECCDTCKHYLIGADLVKEPDAIPLVEDIAALSLHLWAADHGYTKSGTNLFGF